MRTLSNSYPEYLSIESHSNVRHEFIGGEIYAMAGGTPAHGALAARISRIIDGLLPGCTPFSSDVRVHILASKIATYPDVSFVCGPVKTSSEDANAIVNPSVIIEVTSPTTEKYDRTEKLAAYQKLDSLKVILIVSHRQPRISVFERSTNWIVQEFVHASKVEIPSLQIQFAVNDVFDVLEQMK